MKRCLLVLIISVICYGAWNIQAADTPAVESPDAGEPMNLGVTGNPAEIRGKVDDVTVYRDQALVTRSIDVPGGKGLREIIVTDLPEHVVPESIFAESADGVEVRSVRYRIRPVLQDVREEVRKLDQSIQELQDELQSVSSQQQLSTQHREYLGKLEQFTAPTANVELTRGVLNAETLKAISTFVFDQRTSLMQTDLKLMAEQRTLAEKVSLASREREVLTGGSAKTIREAVVFVNLQQATGKLRLRYLVGNADWTPSYNIRTAGDRKQVAIEYHASIRQMSGEDWGNVKMHLSTATPSLAAKAPALEPLVIALGRSEEMQTNTHPANASGKDYKATKKQLAEQQRELEVTRNRSIANNWTIDPSGVSAGGGIGGGGSLPQVQMSENNAAAFDAQLNSIANQSQVLDLINRERWTKSAKPAPTEITEGVSVNYELASRTSLPSRSDRQLIQIASLPMKAEFYKVAVPVLTTYVYEEASVVNDSKHVLLPGPFTTYLDGQFVGRGDLPLVAIGENFTAGFGIDASLRATRELASKTDAIQGGNRVVDFNYALRIENFGAQAAKVRLLDRLPTGKETEIKLTLVSSGSELSTDARYQQTERKKGILRWELEVPAQAIGPKALLTEYKLQMEYDKQMSIAGLPSSR